MILFIASKSMCLTYLILLETNLEQYQKLCFSYIQIKIYNICYILSYFLIITIRHYRDDTKRSEITRLPHGYMKKDNTIQYNTIQYNTIQYNTRTIRETVRNETTGRRKTWTNNILQVNTALSYEVVFPD